jgi:hypothetical protein
MSAKKTRRSVTTYRVKILAPDSATKWVSSESFSFAIEMGESPGKPAQRKQDDKHTHRPKPPAEAA